MQLLQHQQNTVSLITNVQVFFDIICTIEHFLQFVSAFSELCLYCLSFSLHRYVQQRHLVKSILKYDYLPFVTYFYLTK